jgi:hypothetical protein
LIYFDSKTHTISVLKHVFCNLTLFILHTACKLKSVLNLYTRSHDPHIPVHVILCYPHDAASKYRMARVAAPCLLCIKCLHPVMLLLSRLYFWRYRRKGPRCCDCRCTRTDHVSDDLRWCDLRTYAMYISISTLNTSTDDKILEKPRVTGNT